VLGRVAQRVLVCSSEEDCAVGSLRGEGQNGRRLSRVVQSTSLPETSVNTFCSIKVEPPIPASEPFPYLQKKHPYLYS
jgi:hypothetical protein